MANKTYATNVKECLAFCLSLTDDLELREELKRITHEERVVFLLDNGFQFDLSEEEAKVLEELYREKVKGHD